MTISRVRLLLLLSCLTTGARAAEPAPAPSAQAVDDGRRADAKARYEQGVEAYGSGHFKDAVDLFLAADRLSPSAPLSFNIARAYDKLGDDSGALRWYRDYLRRAPTAENSKDVTVLIERLEARLAKKGVQQLSVLSAPPGATVSVDDVNVGVTPGTFDLAPGRHHLVLILRGYADATSDIELAPDRAQDVVFHLETQPVTAAAQPTEPLAPTPAPTTPTAAAPAARAKSGPGVWPWVVLGAGGATLAGALTFELLRQSAEHDAENATTQVDYKDALDKMEARRTTARVLTGVGGALVVGGGVWLALELTGSKSKPGTALSITPTPNGVSGAFAGRF